MGARQISAEARGCGRAADLGEGGLEVGPGLGHGGAHAGDDLDGALEQLVLGLGVLAVGVPRAQLLEQHRRRVGELAGLAVDDAELDLDAEARPGEAWKGICMTGAERSLRPNSLAPGAIVQTTVRP